MPLAVTVRMSCPINTSFQFLVGHQALSYRLGNIQLSKSDKNKPSGILHSNYIHAPFSNYTYLLTRADKSNFALLHRILPVCHFIEGNFKSYWDLPILVSPLINVREPITEPSFPKLQTELPKTDEVISILKSEKLFQNLSGPPLSL